MATTSRLGSVAGVATVLAACNAVLGLEELPRGSEGASGLAGTTGGGGDGGAGPSGGSSGRGSSSGKAGSGGGAGSGASGGSGESGTGQAEGGEGGVPVAGPECGNGAVEEGESCDDDDRDSDDGCSSSCEREAGWSCDDESPTLCVEICGDAKLVGLEARAGGCDDGGTDDGDGCGESCRVEPGWFCSEEPSVCAETCGNGLLDGAEGCDDADLDSDDGCAACTVVDGWECDGEPSVCVDIDECAAEPCEHDGACTDEVNGYTCDCTGTGYSGTTCQTNVNDCGPNPCLNGGTCTDGVNSFICDCSGTGYSGTTCHANVNDCSPNPCQQGGVCMDGVNDYTCDCAGTGYSGKNCQTNVNECSPNPCQNGGACTEGTSSYTCNCTGTGYSGTACQTDVNECTGTNNCHANATCTNTPGSFTCACNGGYSGNGVTCTRLPSCNGLSATCGPSGNSDCCASSVVPGGTFNRDNDAGFPATLSSFRLDTYEVTVGRFRKFSAAYGGGWRPSPGSGKNPSNAEDPGWDSAWNGGLPADGATLTGTSGVQCIPEYQTWTASVVDALSESRPQNCLSWFVAQAFCIWDGGRLPTEAEWNYAAAGGSEQRTYPWGSTTPGANANLAVWGCYYNASGTCTGVTNIARVGTVSAGNARWGQADMAGNLREWVQDWYGIHPSPCNDCALLMAQPAGRVVRPYGSFNYPSTGPLATSSSYPVGPSTREHSNGARCARTP